MTREGRIGCFTALAVLTLSGCGGNERQTQPSGGEGESAGVRSAFFQTGHADLEVSGARTARVSLTRVVCGNCALYRPGRGRGRPGLVLALEAADGSARLSAFVDQIAAPGVYPLSSTELTIGRSHYIRGLPTSRACTVTVKTLGKRSAAGTVACMGLRGDTPDAMGERVSLRGMFRLSGAREAPLPVPTSTGG